MSDKIVTLPCVTKLDLPPDRILDAAQAAILQEVVIIGFDENEEFYFASSKGSAATVLWLLEMAKKRLIEDAE